MFYLSHIPAEGFRLWHLMDSRGGWDGWGGVLGPGALSPAPSVHPDSAYNPVIAYIDSCLLLQKKGPSGKNLVHSRILKVSYFRKQTTTDSYTSVVVTTLLFV